MPGADPADPRSLPGAQDGESDSLLRHDIERFQVHSRFRQPHALRVAAEVALKIANAPNHLGALVPAVGQRHDHVRVCLGDRRTVAAEALAAFFLASTMRLMSVRGRGFQPGEQCRTKVKADPSIVVDDLAPRGPRD